VHGKSDEAGKNELANATKRAQMERRDVPDYPTLYRCYVEHFAVIRLQNAAVTALVVVASSGTNSEFHPSCLITLATLHRGNYCSARVWSNRGAYNSSAKKFRPGG